MCNFTLNTNILKFVFFIGFSVFTIGVSAQVKTTFTPRFSERVNGDITVIANNVLSEHSTIAYNGDTSNQFISSVFVDIDSDDTTFNSSSATLESPSPSITCLSIKRAYLYWVAANREYDDDGFGNISGNGSAEENWPSNQVKLMLPGSSSYTTLTADEVIYNGRVEHFVNDPYVNVKDITSEVQNLSNPLGKFQVANVKATEGKLFEHNIGLPRNTGTAGGWQIVFIYESPQLKQRNITLFDGYANVTNENNSYDVLFDGFTTIPNGTVNANITIGALEGDRSLDGDQLQILDKTGNWSAISTTERTQNNFFNSKITLNDAPFSNRTPNSTNTLGFDTALFKLDNTANNLIDNDQTSATIRMTSDQETYGLYLLGLSIEVFEPNLGALEFKPSSGITNYSPGDTVPLEILVKNVGNDDIENLKISTILPEQVSFVDTDPLPAGVTHSYNDTTRELLFTIQDGITDMNDPLYTISFNYLINDTCSMCNSLFELQATASFTGKTNTQNFTTLSSGNTDTCGNGDHNPISLTVAPTITIESATATEGESINFIISSSYQVPNDITLNVTYTNISASDNDYTTTNSVVILANSNTATLTIPTIDDTQIESTETFEVTLSSSDPINISTNTAAGSILDNDNINSTDYIKEHTIQCGDEIPAVPELIFSGGCEPYTVDFTETKESTDNSDDYMIIRTWNVEDDCGNTGVFEQIIFVMQLEEVFIKIDACITDQPIDLATHLPKNFDANGAFKVTKGIAQLNGSFIDPMTLEFGEYVIEYVSTIDSCTYLATYNITIISDCIDCDIDNISVSATVTPNGDNINDVFKIIGVENCQMKFNLLLFNRWGNKVFEANDYKNDWSGVAPKGSIGTNGNLPSGTYYYLISIMNKPEIKPINGYIYLGTK